MDIVALAFELAGLVEALVARARRFCYEVALSRHPCPRCAGRLEMIAESRCRCLSCNDVFDPTAAFQRCDRCGGTPRLSICRYRCSGCGRGVASRFVFDGLVFDREYFRRRMAESRQRKAERHQGLRELLIEVRSETVVAPAADLEAIPGLSDALDGLVLGPEVAALVPLCRGFDLKRYEAHLEAHIGPIEMCFDEIPPLDEDARMDRIWRFVAVVFMAHAGRIEICQDGQEILVMQRDID